MSKVINISSNGIKQAIDDLVNENELLQDKIYKQNEEIERLNNIINKALKKSEGLQYKFGYVLDDLVYLLMQGSDKE